MVELQLIVFILVVCASSSLKLPPYLKRCSRNDPKMNECILKHGQEAIPHFIHGDAKYGVPDLDPFSIEELKVRQGTQQVGLSLILTNVKVYGLSDVQFVGSRVDLNKLHIEGDFKSEKSIQMIGPYKASGKVLLLPITGEGIANLTFTDMFVTYKCDFTLVKRKGKDYISPLKSDLDYKIGGAHFHLDNLFNGDKLLGDNMNKFLNENWKDLITTFGPEMVSALQATFETLIQRLLAVVPYDDIYPEKL